MFFKGKGIETFRMMNRHHLLKFLFTVLGHLKRKIMNSYIHFKIGNVTTKAFTPSSWPNLLCVTTCPYEPYYTQNSFPPPPWPCHIAKSDSYLTISLGNRKNTRLILKQRSKRGDATASQGQEQQHTYSPPKRQQNWVLGSTIINTASYLPWYTSLMKKRSFRKQNPSPTVSRKCVWACVCV